MTATMTAQGRHHLEVPRHDIVGVEVRAALSSGTAGFARLQDLGDHLGDWFTAGVAPCSGERPVTFPGTPGVNVVSFECFVTSRQSG
jgi:hypothetical protein